MRYDDATSFELIDVCEVDDADQLVGLLSAADRRREKESAGLVWFVQFGTDETPPYVFVGVRGLVGALQRCEGEETALIPRHGIDSAWVDYFTHYGGHLGKPPGSEVPVERVHEAVREFVGTHQRPTCVEWKPQPSIETLF